MEGILLCVREAFAEFGQYTGLKLNLAKSPWLARVAGMQIVPSVRYLGALFGDVSPAEAFERALTTVEACCTLLSRMPLSQMEKVHLIHTWCHPVLQVKVVAYYPPPPPHGVCLPSSGPADGV